MTQDLRVAMTTSLNDRLVAPLRRSLDEIERGLKRAQRELQATQRGSEQTSRTMGTMQGPARAARQVADLARSTQHATTLAERLERAWNRTGAVMKGIGSGMAAWQAAKYVLSGPLKTSQNYGLDLARAGNTAFPDRDEAGWRAGVKDLNATVVSSLRTGGGTRDEVLAALNEMLSSGKVSPDQAKTALPLVAKYATGSGASVVDLSQIVVRALQAGFKEADVGRLLDMALVAGQKGGFELKDMARWLPKLMAAGQQSGLRGFEGYSRILASAEASLTTAGSRDEAGNNLLNLLTKINSADTARDAQKLGIDLPGTLAAARGKGMNSLDAFVALVDKIAARDPRLVDVRKKTASATGEERKAMLESQADILQGSAIGKIVQDRQGLLALVAEMNQRPYIAEIMGSLKDANGQFGATNFDRIASTPAYQIQRQENEKLIAQDRALLDVNSSLGRLAGAATDLYQKYPGFSTVVEAAKIAIGTLAAAAGAAAGALAIFGLAKGGAAGAGAAAAAGGAARAAGYSSLMNGPAAAAGGVAAAGGLAIAGAVALPTAVLGAGMVMSDRMNSVQGLTERINTRNDRLQELNELASLDGKPGKYDREREALTADRDALRGRYGEQVGGGRGVINPPPVNVKVFLDGREMNAHVESETRFQAGRR
jgi:hypothetical protein